ncbi:MAG: DUF6600 domain-containing protein, partial [Acidobacteriota bacterium]
MMKRQAVIWSCMSLVAFAFLWGQEQTDPPSRVARLDFVAGAVSFRQASVDEWATATLNYPLTTGDHLWTDQGARANVHVGSTAVRLADQTNLALLNLDDQTAQVGLTQGIINVHIKNLDSDQTFEVDTPNSAVSLLLPGDYRIDVDLDSTATAVIVRVGDAEVTGGGQAFAVHSRQFCRFSGTDQVAAETLAVPAPDPWDQWCMSRDEGEDRALQASARYVSQEMTGAEDLAQYGEWRNDASYGAIWMPTQVVAGWEPYRYGRWAYAEPWGWTWIDDAPWGFAPFHYGRWAMIGARWAWVPGAVVARPIYAPALVAFIGGSGFSLAIGGGSVAAWVPLGPREVYHPSYRVSEAYVRNVNIPHVRNISNINAVNVTYVNQTHVTAVRHNDFTGARSVAAAAIRIPPSAIARAQTVTALNIPPARESRMGQTVRPGVRVVAPPTRVMNREVTVKQAPPEMSRRIPVRIAPPASINRQQQRDTTQPPPRNMQPPPRTV